jgi:type IV pilus assembly protein PilX
MHARKSERGAILIISLLLLLILTVLGLAVMRMTRMQERMAGNTRDLNLALQGAESALRDGEARILAFPARPLDVGVLPCGLTASEVCQSNTLPVGIAELDDTWWNTYALEFGAAGKQITELSADPRYTVEWVGTSRLAGLGIGQEPPEVQFVYQVTGRSTGASGSANTVLQSTFARVY